MARNATDGDEAAEGFATLCLHFRPLWQISTTPKRLCVEKVIATNIRVNRISRRP
jgi:hypothetical protein